MQEQLETLCQILKTLSSQIHQLIQNGDFSLTNWSLWVAIASFIAVLYSGWQTRELKRLQREQNRIKYLDECYRSCMEGVAITYGDLHKNFLTDDACAFLHKQLFDIYTKISISYNLLNTLVIEEKDFDLSKKLKTARDEFFDIFQKFNELIDSQQRSIATRKATLSVFGKEISQSEILEAFHKNYELAQKWRSAYVDNAPSLLEMQIHINKYREIVESKEFDILFLRAKK